MSKISFDDLVPKDSRSSSGNKERTVLDEGIRKAGLASKGFSDSVLEAVGALPDLVGSGLRAIGAPAPADPDFYTKKLKEGYQGLGSLLASPLEGVVNAGGIEPESRADKIALGAGRGAGAATTFLAPAAALGNLAKAGSVTQKAAAAAAQQPKTQVAAGLLGGATTGATDSELAGLATSLLTPVPAAALRKVAFPGSQVGGERERLVDEALKAGIKLTPGQATGSRPLAYTESAFANLPFTASKQAAIDKAQRKTLNKEVLKTVGIDSSEVTPKVLDDAFNEIGKEFQDLASKSSIKVSEKFFDNIQNVANGYSRRLPNDVKSVFQSYVDDFMKIKKELKKKEFMPDKDGNAWTRKPVEKSIIIDGDVYAKMSSDLRRAARGKKKTDPDLAFAIRQLSKTLDDELGKNVGKSIKDKWNDTRRRYRNLLIIQDATKGTAKDRSEGDIGLAALQRAVARDNPKYARGEGDLNNLARIADFLSANRLPDSGTTQRQIMSGLLTLGPGMAVSNLPMALLGITLPKVTQTGLNAISPRYLTNQTTAQKMLRQQFPELVNRRPASPLTGSILAAQGTGNLLSP